MALHNRFAGLESAVLLLVIIADYAVGPKICDTNNQIEFFWRRSGNPCNIKAKRRLPQRFELLAVDCYIGEILDIAKIENEAFIGGSSLHLDRLFVDSGPGEILHVRIRERSPVFQFSQIYRLYRISANIPIHGEL